MIFNDFFEGKKIFFGGRAQLDFLFKIEKFFSKGGTIRQGEQKDSILYIYLNINYYIIL